MSAVCMYACMCACMCACPRLPAGSSFGMCVFRWRGRMPASQMARVVPSFLSLSSLPCVRIGVPCLSDIRCGISGSVARSRQKNGTRLLGYHPVCLFVCVCVRVCVCLGARVHLCVPLVLQGGRSGFRVKLGRLCALVSAWSVWGEL